MTTAETLSNGAHNSPGQTAESVAPSHTDKLLIDMAELARLTTLSVRTLRRMDASRDIPGRVVVRRCVRFQTQIIGQWVHLGLPNNDRWAELQKRNLSGGK